MPDSSFIIIAFSAAGFFLARYMYHKRTAGGKLVCPVGESCDIVTHSSYSAIFGIPVQALGMAYYGTIAVAEIAMSVGSGYVRQTYDVFSVWDAATIGAGAIAAVAVFGFVFSIYLSVLQAFVLRHWCSLCVLSALFTVALSLLAVREFWIAVSVQPVL